MGKYCYVVLCDNWKCPKCGFTAERVSLNIECKCGWTYKEVTHEPRFNPKTSLR